MAVADVKLTVLYKCTFISTLQCSTIIVQCTHFALTGTDRFFKTATS